MISIGEAFPYLIPSFAVLEVELRQMRIKGYTTVGDEENYDVFIRNDPTLSRSYPVWMFIKDGIVEVQ